MPLNCQEGQSEGSANSIDDVGSEASRRTFVHRERCPVGARLGGALWGDGGDGRVRSDEKFANTVATSDPIGQRIEAIRR